ncbi:hypothetical protein ANCDUO_21813, partial [Ancylostoma duodenale]
ALWSIQRELCQNNLVIEYVFPSGVQNRMYYSDCGSNSCALGDLRIRDRARTSLIGLQGSARISSDCANTAARSSTHRRNRCDPAVTH